MGEGEGGDGGFRGERPPLALLSEGVDGANRSPPFIRLGTELPMQHSPPPEPVAGLPQRLVAWRGRASVRGRCAEGMIPTRLPEAVHRGDIYQTAHRAVRTLPLQRLDGINDG